MELDLRLMRLVIPACLIAAAALAVSFAAAQQRDPYEFKVNLKDHDITAKAADVVIEPRFKAVADDRFAYEYYYNVRRQGRSTENGSQFESFRRTENWTAWAMLNVRENELDGRADSQIALQYERLNGLVDNGRGRYSVYVGPTDGALSAKFEEILPDGSRNNVTSIPGWAGITASTIESNRATQSGFAGAAAWFSVDEQGRLYDEQYFADLGSPDQRNYPGVLIDPVHIALGSCAEFTKGASLKLGQTIEITRRFPLGVVPGATAQYRFTYKLEKLYGTVEEPTAAQFSFTAVPVQQKHSVKVGNLSAEYDAPSIEGGTLLYDLAKGVTADVTWAYTLKGVISQQGTTLRTEFGVEADFRASLRNMAKKAE